MDDFKSVFTRIKDKIIEGAKTVFGFIAAVTDAAVQYIRGDNTPQTASPAPAEQTEPRIKMSEDEARQKIYEVIDKAAQTREKVEKNKKTLESSRAEPNQKLAAYGNLRKNRDKLAEYGRQIDVIKIEAGLPGNEFFPQKYDIDKAAYTAEQALKEFRAAKDQALEEIKDTVDSKTSEPTSLSVNKPDNIDDPSADINTEDTDIEVTGVRAKVNRMDHEQADILTSVNINEMEDIDL